MVKLLQDNRGHYKARKRLPDDVRDEYARLYGPRLEAKFSAPASTKRQTAQQLFNEWLADVEARIAAIRAEQNGEGVSLTPRQARALAGEWYEWFTARHSADDWDAEAAQEHVHDAIRRAVGEKRWEQNQPNELWEAEEDLRAAVRPLLADIGETAQFLASKQLVLNHEARSLFLDFLYKDLAAALKVLIRQSGGDYSPDKYREQFPKYEGGDGGETPTQLFERWVAERQPPQATIETWGYVFARMSKHFDGRSAASITPDEAQQWLKNLVTEKRSAATVRNTDLRASNAIFNWAVTHKHVPRNPFKDARITVPRKTANRDTKAFYPEEYRRILRAALEIQNVDRPFETAKRWMPWLLAYTGARPAEIGQLRRQDVIERDGVRALHLTPEAGPMKSGKARTVPLHEHLLAQGFLEFVDGHAGGPLFYKGVQKAPEVKRMNAKKPRGSQVRQRLADWVRSLGVSDKELSPNHAWRHTFKQIADRSEISERMSDAITGHAPRSVGAAYGAPTLEDMAKAMKKFPRYVLG